MGDLRSFISKKSFKNYISIENYLSNNKVKLELFEGMSFMHSQKVIHRDKVKFLNVIRLDKYRYSAIFSFKLKSNILLFFNEQKNDVSIKIGDLGNSKEMHSLHDVLGGLALFSKSRIARKSSLQ
jgi:serine/threonine protein kinase